MKKNFVIIPALDWPLHRRILVLAIGALVGYALFSPGLLSGYLADDFAILRPQTLPEHLESWTAHDFYRPLLIFLFWLFDIMLFDRSSFLSHGLGVGLHLANTLLVYATARRLFPTHPHSRNLAGAAAVLFLTFPRHTETVVWMGARADLLCGLFLLGGLLLFLQHCTSSIVMMPYFSLSLAGACFLFLAALLTKETGVIYLPLATCVLYLFSKERRPRNLYALVPPLVVLGLYLYLRASALGLSGAYDDIRTPLRVAVAFPTQLLALVVPGFFDFFRIQGPDAHSVLLSLVAVCALASFVSGIWYVARTTSVGMFVVAALLISLAPAAGIVTLKYTANERVLYIPSIWFCIGLAVMLWSGGRRLERNRARIIAALATGFAVASFALSFNWYHAGQLRDAAASQPPGRVELDGIRFVTLPDNYRGAYIFRNGYEDYLSVMDGRPRLRRTSEVGNAIFLNVESRDVNFKDAVRITRISSREVVLQSMDGLSFRSSPWVYSTFASLNVEAHFDGWIALDAAKILRLRLRQ